jgi:hypothetical protein
MIMGLLMLVFLEITKYQLKARSTSDYRSRKAPERFEVLKSFISPAKIIAGTFYFIT